jgi:cytochrome c-type biogenesis protein CcmH/NrfG
MLKASYFSLAFLLLSTTASPGDADSASTGKTSAATLKRDSALCSVQANIDACYDAIRWSPNDPALLVGLGDALLRAKRSQDAIRSYRRAAALAPGMPGLAAKITAAEQTLTSKQGSARPLGDRTAGSAVADKRYSNAAPEAQSH